MGLTAKYLDQHAQNATDATKGDKAAYEKFGRDMAQLLMKNASKSQDVYGDKEVKTVALSGISATLSQQVSLICVDITVHTPLGDVTAHIGAG